MDRRLRLQLAMIALLCGGAAIDARAASRWTAVQSGSMTVIGDQPATTLRAVALELEQFSAVLGRLSASRLPAVSRLSARSHIMSSAFLARPMVRIA